jgi:hypothetical protein
LSHPNISCAIVVDIDGFGIELALHHQNGAQQIGIDAVVIGCRHNALIQGFYAVFDARSGHGGVETQTEQHEKYAESEKLQKRQKE